MQLTWDIIILIAGLGIILLGAELFTNSVEWLGKGLKFSQGAVGSILAAVGTAMPETMIPVIALVFGGEVNSEEIGIGAILGAPFMLSTLAFFITGLAVLIYSRRGRRPPQVQASPAVMRRDLSYFLMVYTLVVLAGLVDLGPWKHLLAIVLVGLYGYYVWRTFTHQEDDEPEVELGPLVFEKVTPTGPHDTPHMWLVVLQFVVALGLIIGGAKSLIHGVSLVSEWFGIPAFVLAVVIAPIATELPEKFNSVIWVRQGKDTLALGNITGAMVFQSSIIPAIGILLTPWRLSGLALVTVILAMLSSTVAYVNIRRTGTISAPSLLLGGLFYLAFVAAVAIVH